MTHANFPDVFGIRNLQSLDYRVALIVLSYV